MAKVVARSPGRGRARATATTHIDAGGYMSSPYTPYEHRKARARVDADALGVAADVLRQLAAHDAHLDVRRGDVSKSLAALVEVCARSYGELPREVARQAMGVATAVDRATGQRS